MLQIWMGRANTGKSRKVLEQMRARGQERRQLLLVPEHASHEAERDLCQACGPSASRYAEVLSIRRLAFRVLSETGGAADTALDAGGKLLTMFLVLGEVLPQLKVYARPSRKAGFLQELVTLCDELQSFQVLPEDLAAAAGPDLAGGKVGDIALIYAAYLGRLERGKHRDIMARMLERLEMSGYLDGKDIYLDGFTYFTAQEKHLISIALSRAENVTVTLLGDDSGLEVFQRSLKTRAELFHLAAQCGVSCRVVNLEEPAPQTPQAWLAARFFGPFAPWPGPWDGVRLYRADSVYHEVEYVAARILELVRTKGCRFREIAVAARNLKEYEAAIESVFARYGVPVYLSRRSDVLEKPVLSLLAGALDAVTGGYAYEDMFRWLKTGLAGLSEAECDVLENYVIAWDIHGAMWTQDADWSANPDGWQEEFTPQQAERLAHVNELRRRVGEPLRRLADGLQTHPGARDKLRVLWQFLEELNLAERLQERTKALEDAGQLQAAREYGQLWELLCAVMDQFVDILRDEPLDTEEFARLLKLVLTQYDVGTIPVSLDQVQASQITRNDRHRMKYLFLMGANDHVLPAPPPEPGLLGREDRERLRQRGVDLAPTGEEVFQLELMNLYAALAQPTDLLEITWPATDMAGETLRPSIVVDRTRMLLPGIPVAVEQRDRPYRLTSPVPALELAGGPGGEPLRRFFAAEDRWAPALAAMDRAAGMGREAGRLSRAAVEALYGRRYRMSASRIDQINSCHFAYFMRYGLRAKARAPAGFDAGQVGTFLHYVLERVVRGTVERGGFAALAKGELDAIREDAVAQYMESILPGFDEKAERFKYLFRRLKKTVGVIVDNVAGELGNSDFVPVAFELEFGGKGKLSAISIRTGNASLSVSGKVDRVDGWIRDNKLYLRVVDYKSGKKAFDLSDVRYGLNIQLLLYLFALEKEGKAIFGREVVPAGVMYLPTRDVLVRQGRAAGEEEIRAALDKELRRSGMLLNDPEVLQAMEHGALESPRFLPLHLGRDGSIAKGVASAEELGKLGKYVERILENIAEQMQQGNVDTDPWGRTEAENACTYCEYASACHFAEEKNRFRWIQPVSPPEFWQHVERTVNGPKD